MSATWSFAVPDWRDRLIHGRSLVPDLPLDRVEADRAVSVFNRLRLPDVSGQPTLGEAAGEWFREIVAAIGGSIDLDTTVRHVPDVFLLVPKKNSKTTNGAGLMLTALLINRRPNALFGLFGPTQEISDIAFQAIVGMIDADAGLKKILHPRDHLKRIDHRRSGAALKITTFDPAVATGGKFAGWLLDEAHLLGSVRYASRVIGQLRGARLAIPESFGVIITTQSEEPPTGAFRSELQTARGVRDGTITDVPLLSVLYEFPEEIQTDRSQRWRDPALWPMVTPNLGRSVNLDVMQREYAAARTKGDEEERRWASQHLNVEIGLALHSDRWRGADHWLGAVDETITLDTIIERCEVCTVGIDGGGLDDLLGLAVIGRERGTGRWLAWCRAWCDAIVLERRQDIAAALMDFEKDGHLRIIDLSTGEVEDFAEVAAIVARLWEAGMLPEKNAIGVDPAGIAAIAGAIVEAGVPLEAIYGVGQGYRLNGTIKATARKLMDGSLRHAPQRIMDWCVGNAKIVVKGSAETIEKAVSGSAKIDPLVALFNASDAMGRNPEPAVGRSFWEPAA